MCTFGRMEGIAGDTDRFWLYLRIIYRFLLSGKAIFLRDFQRYSLIAGKARLISCCREKSRKAAKGGAEFGQKQMEAIKRAKGEMFFEGYLYILSSNC